MKTITLKRVNGNYDGVGVLCWDGTEFDVCNSTWLSACGGRGNYKEIFWYNTAGPNQLKIINSNPELIQSALNLLRAEHVGNVIIKLPKKPRVEVTEN